MKTWCWAGHGSDRIGLVRGFFRLGLMLGLALVVAGCIVIPTPEHDSGNARSNLSKESPAKIQPGGTTFEDVLLTFGEPDAVSADERKLAYRSEKIVGYWAAGGYYSATGGTLTKDRYLLIQFDEQGVVRQREFTSRLFVPAVPEKLLETKGWTEASAAAVGARARISGRADWFPNIEGFQVLVPGPGRYSSGYLVLTDQALEFRDRTQLANEAPSWSIGYATLMDCRLAKYFLNRRVVIRTNSGEVHSFSLLSSGGGAVDKKQTATACEFIQSKLEELNAARTNRTSSQVISAPHAARE